MTRPFIRVIVGLAIMGSFFLGPAAEEAAAQKKYLSLGTGNPGGTFYFIGAGFANLYNRYVPGVRVIAESTAASEENFHYLLRKKIDLGLISIHVIDAALEKTRLPERPDYQRANDFLIRARRQAAAESHQWTPA